MELNLLQGDCLELFSQIPDNSVDLIVTDPPYQIDNTKAGNNSALSKRIQSMNDELTEHRITDGFDEAVLDQMVRVLKNINIYIWCNAKQIPMYFKYFVEKLGCAFDIIVWVKSNAAPLFNNKYLTDKEYCLYFRRGGYCQPASYEKAKTAYFQPLNVRDKQMFKHPTIKPLNIIQTLVSNSSKENDTVLDCFMGSGTTGVACVKLNRNFIGMEINENFFKIAQARIKIENQPKLF
ncbi:MAG: site-specific DNA-methyltransferase [Lachnospiraceae bacterium]|nr:site-specific DNA-methyltransferase [Lachnospiraceae bacterium]